MRPRTESLLAPGSLLRQTLPAQAIASLSVAIIDLEAHGIVVGPSIYCCDEHAEEHLLAIAREHPLVYVRGWAADSASNA